MGRKSIMVNFDPTAFRETVKGSGRGLSDLEPITGVTKQALNGWLNTGRIPPRQLYTIASKLKWPSTEVEKILRQQSQNIFFRSHRNVLPTQAAENDARRLAKDFFTLDSLVNRHERDAFVFRVGKGTPAQSIADGILKQLELRRGQFGLDELIIALIRVNIFVAFADFGAQFSTSIEATSTDLKAFCAKQGNKFLIAVDSRMKIEDVIWAIFHELAHIVCGDLDQDSRSIDDTELKLQESFRNEVASEVLTPTELLRSSIQLKKLLACNIIHLPSRVEHIASELGASFMGVILALKKAELITPQMQKYLFSVYHRRKNSQLSVQELIAPNMQFTSVEKLITFWDQRLNTEELQKFLRLHLLVRQGLIEGKLSIDRAAELMGISHGEMEELERHWIHEVSDEATY